MQYLEGIMLMSCHKDCGKPQERLRIEGRVVNMMAPSGGLAVRCCIMAVAYVKSTINSTLLWGFPLNPKP